MPLYLAMTAAELSACQQLPEKVAYMACHFSPYGTGLSNLPEVLPKGAMIILNDRIPIYGHEPNAVAEQLVQLCKTWEADSLLLDLQRADDHTPAVIREILKQACCPVGVSELYAKDFDCPVFLSSPPLHIPPGEYYAPWEPRELWLEAAPEHYSYAITEQDCQLQSLQPEAPLPCPELFCHYGFHKEPNRLVIGLERTREDLQKLIGDSRITKAIGLYQQLGKKERLSPEETAAHIQNLPPPPP